MPYTTILIPLDGSPDSVFACETATDIACPDSVRIAHLVHCVEHIPDLIGGARRDARHAEQRNESDKVFAQARSILEPKGFTCHTHIREGEPAEEIVSVAKETGCDIIIMGSRGQSRLECLFVGAVSSEVLKNSPVPVLLANKPLRPA